MSLILFTLFLASGAGAAGIPAEGDVFPALTLPAPSDPADREDLGLAGESPFALADIKADLVVLEVIGVYCPQCAKQLPGFIDFSKRLKKARLDKRVKILGLAVGGTPMEVAHLRAHGGYTWPVAPDPNYEAHKILGEPRTPFTLVVDHAGKIRYAHLGVIEDMDAFFRSVKDMLP